MTAGAAVVVVLAPPGAVPAAVRDVLRDWVTLGLVQPLLWVDADGIEDGAPLSSVVGTHLLPDDAPRVRLQDHLANQRSMGLLRLVALGALGGQTALLPPALAGSLHTGLSALAPGRVVALQCVLCRQGAGGWQPEVAVPGWRTLVLAPEDSWSPSPTQPSTEFAVGGHEAEYTAHAAAGVASVAGLWTGVGAGPFDAPTGENDDPLVVRAFLRRLDTSATSSRLRRALTDVSAGLPLPQSGHGRIEALQDPEQGVRDLHEALVQRHAALFEVAEVRPEEVRAEVIGSLGAVRMFLAFVWSSIKAAPSAFLERMKGQGAALVSRKVQDALFGGQDSRYEVVTRGVNAAGLPPGVRELGAVADDVRQRLSPVLPGEAAVPDLSGFWTDVAAGALSLADAGEHGSGVGPVLVGSTPRVVRDTSLIAPAPADAFPLPPAVATRTSTDRVSPHDSRAQAQAAEAIAQSPHVDRTGADFERWRARVDASYTGRLGTRLATEVEQRARRLRELLHELQRDEESVDEDLVGQGLRTVRMILLRTVLGLVLIGVLTWLVVALDLLGALVLASLVVLAVVAWLVSQVIAVLRQQTRVFALLNAQRESQQAREVASRNLPIAAAALQLSATMYGQHLAWAPVLGRFVREPFGPVPEPTAAARLDGLLPRAVGFGIAEADDQHIAAAAHDVGSTVFRRGWLQPLWEAFLADAPRLLGPAGLALRDDPGLLLRDHARGDQSLLRRWSAAVVEQGVPPGAGDELWRRARAALLSRGTARLSEELLVEVEVQAQQAHDVRERLSGREFFTTLTDALGDVERHYFGPQLFTDLAIAQDRHRVVVTTALGRPEVAALGAGASSSRVTWIDPAADAEGTLDQFLVVVQASAAVPGELLTLRGPLHRAGAPDDQPPPGRPWSAPPPSFPAAPSSPSVQEPSPQRPAQPPLV